MPKPATAGSSGKTSSSGTPAISRGAGAVSLLQRLKAVLVANP
ncbi:MAG: hypothetical protein QGI86_24885 [Candidatus Poribacteria bacterium]|nr:hypothetical protein [Candidatus Poribacteria bacterium]MDP6750892.1 hypothetical protein [Candidatus Poribacteria bacterium]MDP6999382.1 hypothetical protein [Candidatus Poribacteria bacterium]